MAWQLPAADDPAYVFFTSGSTGRPKGILGQHKGVAHFLDWQRRTFAIHAGDRVAWLTHLSFDPVLRDLFLPLTSGATLCLPPREGMAPEEELAWLAEAGVTVVHVVPSRARYWLQAAPEALRLPVRITFFAGEPLAGDLVERWRGLCPAGSLVVNLYGPTETTMAKAFHVVPPGSAAGLQPIGQPQPATQLWIVNQARQLCGVGEPGEIVIRTPFRTLGYIHPTAEDAARFQANWFTGDARDVVFLTGDLGRYRPDGSISILGRKDHQVKVGGVRVELEEVEAVLGRHGGVRACAVAAGDGDDGVARLTAYVEPAELPLDVAALRRHLLDWLPAAMTPAVFVIVDPLPRLTNGKVDRTALRRLAVTSIEPSTAFVPPSTPVEQVLAQIWCRVLQREQVGVEDDFFQLGGHSLAAMRVLTRIQSQLGMSVGLRAFFERPTIAGLAAAILTGTVADLAAAERNRLMEEMESQA
jgi:amino acid adenylation domain-containing protein